MMVAFRIRRAGYVTGRVSGRIYDNAGKVTIWIGDVQQGIVGRHGESLPLRGGSFATFDESDPRSFELAVGGDQITVYRDRRIDATDGMEPFLVGS